MSFDSTLAKIKSAIDPLTREDFWSDDNIKIELDLPYLHFSEGSVEIETFCDTKTEDIIKTFIISILKGEYIYSETLDLLKQLINDLDSISENATIFQNDNLKFNNKYFNDNFYLPIRFCITKYISGIVSLHNIVFNDKIDYLLESNSDDESNIYSNAETADSISKLLDLFYYNLITLRIENQLGTSPSDYHTLHSISLQLQRTNYDSVLKNILDQKCQFLRYKLVMRRKKQNITVKILRDGNFTEHFIDDDTSNHFISKWKILIRKHYLQEFSNIEYYQSFYDVVKRKPNSQLTFEELHKLIKFSKDIKKDYFLLSSYVDEIKKRENVDDFTDHRAYVFKKNYNYALNNKFSFLVSIDNVDIQNVENLYNEIKVFQSTHDINNFFVDFKFLGFIEKQLSLVKYDNIEKFIEKTQRLIEIGERIIKDYKNNIEWSKNNLLYLYHLEYENSTIEIENISIFIPSNFQLPLVPDYYYKEFQQLTKKFNIQKYRYDVYMQIQPEINKVNELEKKDRRDLERLSLFTAVISFIIGGVSGFAFIKDLFSALLFFIVFTTSLITFIITLFAFTRGKAVIKENKIYIYWLYGIFLSALTLLTISTFFSHKSRVNSELDKIKQRLDKDSLEMLKKSNSEQTLPTTIINNQKAISTQKKDSTPQLQGGESQLKNQ